MRRFIIPALALFAILALTWTHLGRDLWLIDVSFYYDGAYRFLLGQKPHRDFQSSLPWPTYAVPGLWMKLWGTSFKSFLSVLLLQQILLFVLVYRWTQLLFKHAALSLLAAAHTALWLGTISMPWYDLNAWFCLIVSMGTFVEALKPESRLRLLWIFLSGAGITFTFFFKQNIGVGAGLLGLALAAWIFFVPLFERWNRWACLLALALGAGFGFFLGLAPQWGELLAFKGQIIDNARRFKGNIFARLLPSLARIGHDPAGRSHNLLAFFLPGQFPVYFFTFAFAWRAYRAEARRKFIGALAALSAAAAFAPYLFGIASQINSNAYIEAVGSTVVLFAWGAWFTVRGQRALADGVLRRWIKGAFLASILLFVIMDYPARQVNCQERMHTTSVFRQVKRGPFQGYEVNPTMAQDLEDLDEYLSTHPLDRRKSFFGFPMVTIFTGVYGFQPWGRWIQFSSGMMTFPEDYQALDQAFQNAPPDYVLTGNAYCSNSPEAEWAAAPRARAVEEGCELLWRGQAMRLKACSARK